ncbi:MAG: M14/M99 family metallopeptidase [Pseudomonadota bacterium]
MMARSEHMKRKGAVPRWPAALAALIFGLLAGWASASPAQAQGRVHTVYFEGSDHELNIYRINGKQAGTTIMLIGGIQGDEPGGFLSVDHYADISLEKGSLIVVPRANWRSIIENRRGVYVDMNRQFSTATPGIYEAEVVDILKGLIADSDCLLNLHDGSGFYAGTWVNEERNPQKFGQSIIADEDVYTDPNTGRRIALGDIARRVCETINRRISDPEHHFHFNNHQTTQSDSRHKEQRKSATYYALTVCGIPAFGIETSKSLSLEDKVYQHNLAVNAFMQAFDVVPETPGLRLETPRLDYLVVAVNDALPVVVKNHQQLNIAANDTVTVSHIEANYERGMSADILGLGAMNDLRRPVVVNATTEIVVRKDNYPCGGIKLLVTPGLSAAVDGGNGIRRRVPDGSWPELVYKVRRNGEAQLIPNEGTLHLIKGDRFEIVDVFTSTHDSAQVVVNVKGFVGNRRTNTGEDRGFVIDSGSDLWQRYALNPEGTRFQVLTTSGDDQLGRLFIEVMTPRLEYILLGNGDGRHIPLFPGSVTTLDPGQSIQLVDVRTNIPGNDGVSVLVSAPGDADRRMLINEPIRLSVDPGRLTARDYLMTVWRGGMELGSVHLSFARN